MFADIRAAYSRDPALHGIRAVELILYPGLWAVWIHRLSSRLYRWGVPFLPRLISQTVRGFTGIEIHPGATLGKRLFIDHGAGVVIGETAVVGDDVTLYHQVTLGGRGFRSDAKGSRRHPVLGDRVTVGVGASILGRVNIGDGVTVGAHALVLEDVPAGAKVFAPAAVVVIRESNSRNAGGRNTSTNTDIDVFHAETAAVRADIDMVHADTEGFVPCQPGVRS